jgi:lipopolysaccharide export system protein LptC
MSAVNGTSARQIPARDIPAQPADSPRRPRPPQLERRTRVVAAMRLILPATAAILLAALALWSRFGFDTDSFRLAMGSLGLTSIDTLSMSNPHFEGMDNKNRPFNVTASKATQADAKADVINLNAPQADITLEDGAWLTVTAESGKYKRGAQLLDLNGQVNLFHDQGYELHTRDVHIDLGQGSAVSNDTVDGQGPSGALTAQGMRVANGGQRILFRGPAHMTFFEEGQLSAAVPKP